MNVCIVPVLPVLVLLNVCVPVGDVSKVTAKHSGAELPHALSAVTQILPPEVLKLTVMESVPAPVAIEAPAGSVQV